MFDEVNDVIEQYLRGDLKELTGSPAILPDKKAKRLSFFASSHPTMSELFKRIKELYEMRDLNRNIYWQEARDANGRPILIRDATEQREVAEQGTEQTELLTQSEVPAKDVGQYNYPIMAYAYLMSYMKIVALENLLDTLNYQKVIKVIDGMMTSKSSTEIREKLGTVIGVYITPALEKAKFEKKGNKLEPNKIKEWAIKQLDEVKKWVAMEEQSITFVTLNKIGSRIIAQIDQPVLTITEEQKEQYEACQSVNVGPLWFKKLTVIERKLVLSYKAAIIAGRIIPSQLRHNLLGIKNAYVHLTEEVVIPPVIALTRVQREQFNACLAIGRGPAWFTQLDETAQAWILANKHEITTNELSAREIAQQIPMLTRLYCTEIGRYLLPPIDMVCESITQYYHCGTIVHLDPLETDGKTETKTVSQESKDITAMNARQQVAATTRVPNLEHQAVMITLNSRYTDRILGPYHALKGTTYNPEDERIVVQTEEVTTPGFSTAKVCLNNARLIERINPKGIVAVCINADKLFAAIYPQSFYDRLMDPATKVQVTKTELREAYNKYVRVIPEDLRIILFNLRQKIDQCLELMDNEPLVKLNRDKDVVGLAVVRLTCEIAELTNQVLENYGYPEDLKNAGVCTTSVFFGCASGNNRTGFQEFDNNFQALKVWCVEKDIRIDDAELQKILALSYHIQLIKGFQGGDFGLDGIRAKSIGSAPQEYTDQVKKLLITEWSDYKSIKDIQKANATHEKQKNLEEARQTLVNTQQQQSM